MWRESLQTEAIKCINVMLHYICLIPSSGYFGSIKIHSVSGAAEPFTKQYSLSCR